MRLSRFSRFVDAHGVGVACLAQTLFEHRGADRIFIDNCDFGRRQCALRSRKAKPIGEALMARDERVQSLVIRCIWD